MLLVVSDDIRQGECCLLCQMMKASVGFFFMSDDEDQGGCCLLCQMMKASASVVCCVR